MIKASHNPLVYGFFKVYAHMLIKKHFYRVRIRGEIQSTLQSILLLSNHISWWDGFWALYLNRTVLKKKFYFMMDEVELKKRGLFARSGGFSINNHHKSLFESLHYTEELLSNRNNLVLIYPQGKLYSSHCSEIHFKKGIERIQLPAKNRCKVVLLVQITDYYQHKKPTLYMYLQEADEELYRQKNYAEQYQIFYDQCLKNHTQITV